MRFLQKTPATRLSVLRSTQDSDVVVDPSFSVLPIPNSSLIPPKGFCGAIDLYLCRFAQLGEDRFVDVFWEMVGVCESVREVGTVFVGHGRLVGQLFECDNPWGLGLGIRWCQASMWLKSHRAVFVVERDDNLGSMVGVWLLMRRS